MPEPRAESDHVRARLLVAAGALVALVILIVVVLLGSGGEEREFASAPNECLTRWNSSEDALGTGIHNSSAGHDYFRVQVAYASEGASTISPQPLERGRCVVIFAGSQLDPEPIAAAEINIGGSWVPLSASADRSRLAELQSQALGDYNAELAQDGTITAVEGGSG